MKRIAFREVKPIKHVVQNASAEFAKPNRHVPIPGTEQSLLLRTWHLPINDTFVRLALGGGAVR